ncbi:MAG: helix-turn-helix domain-containing protein [Flavobacteriaceae bacterium]|nr:AraC family transcriptional regulator [Flavobacteriaceae bacterium]
MKYYINFNDSTEPLVLLWAPLVYLFIYGVLKKREFRFKNHWYHFLLPFLYFVTQIGYYFHPKSVKLTAYLSAYFPQVERPNLPDGLSFYYDVIKGEFRWIILLSFLLYIILSLRIIAQSSNQRKETKRKKFITKYDFTKNIFVLFFVLILIILAIFLNFENDLGDHYIALVQTLVIFAIGFMIFSESRFFEKSWLADKYETLKTEDKHVSIGDIKHFIDNENYYLKKNASLKELSERLNANPNYISKTINLKTDMNFNEFINLYRIQLSKKRLLDEDFKHLTIEAIGNSVGFKSKSAFYNAFKRHAGLTPTAFVKNHH